MLNEKVAKMLNEQINKELFSAYLYLHMSDYYAEQGLEGFEQWFYVQTQEEKDHAMLFRKYLLNNGVKVDLETIEVSKDIYGTFKEPLVAALKHEEFVTASINAIYEEAFKVKDFRTMQFLDWFIKEQGEEEKSVDDIIKKYELFAGDAKGLYMLDNELKARIYSAPSLVLD